MAYFAKLDSENNVLGLHTVSEANCTNDATNVRSEETGVSFLTKIHKDPPVAKPTTGGPYDWDEDTQAWVQAVAPGAQ